MGTILTVILQDICWLYKKFHLYQKKIERKGIELQ